jgi:hypothetical protein
VVEAAALLALVPVLLPKAVFMVLAVAAEAVVLQGLLMQVVLAVRASSSSPTSLPKNRWSSRQPERIHGKFRLIGTTATTLLKLLVVVAVEAAKAP